MNKTILNQTDVAKAAHEVAELISIKAMQSVKLFGVPRGGVPAAYLVQRYLQTGWGISSIVTDSPDVANVIIDDLIDSGATRDHYMKLYPDVEFYALFTKQLMGDPTSWLVFPWEMSDDESSADDIPIRLLQYIGENVERGGLQETPKRFLKAWDHYSSGYGQDPTEILKVFTDGSEKCDEMVLVKDIPVYSHCEHHLAPFFGVAHVAYIPNGSIVGLSKLSRLVNIFARRLQVQERLTNQIADALEEALKPLGVAVVVDCRHMCMESRGIQQQGSSTITSAMRGAFKEKSETRAEFMGFIKK